MKRSETLLSAAQRRRCVQKKLARLNEFTATGWSMFSLDFLALGIASLAFGLAGFASRVTLELSVPLAFCLFATVVAALVGGQLLTNDPIAICFCGVCVGWGFAVGHHWPDLAQAFST